MKNATSLEIYTYWNMLRKHRNAPARAEIDPLQIRSILPDLFMLKQENRSCLSFGLTGTRLYNLFQRELGHTAFQAIWHENVAGYVDTIARGVIEHELPVIFEVVGETSDGVETVALEMVLLPLVAEKNGTDRLLGCISCEPARDDFSRPLLPFTIIRSGLLAPAVSFASMARSRQQPRVLSK